ncbi:hypothetical protein SBA4_1210027 [Candidatus Sulfopaludibacter sp. SbA4]|nr:hypothetical protein SBA4_1210027 [Candidatus Sulfopaludibacter sp. SbA4]
MDEALALPQGLGAIGVREPIPFVGLPSKESAKQLSGSTEDLVKTIVTIVDQLLVSAIDKRTAAEFLAFWHEVFPNYARVMFAMGTLAKALIPPLVLERVTSESLCEMEVEFSDNALAAFGPAIRDQGLFTVWTLRKINDLSRQLSNAVSENEKDGEFAWEFIYHGLRTRFHLDCLLTSMRRRHPIYPEVLDQVSDGLRSAVDAYAWIRQCVDLRIQPQDPKLSFIDLDAEDREFVDASARDMANESA